MSSAGVAAHMANAHGPLARTQTAPVFSSARSAGNGLPGLSQTMSHSSRSSQLSGSTAFTSSSTTSLSSLSSSATLVPPMSTPQNGGPVIATNNIINQKADSSRSLYQICVNLRRRLATVPGFDLYLNDSDDDDDEEDMDPVSSLWRSLRKGTPLLTIYNSLQPPNPLSISETLPEMKKPKAAAFKFVAECLTGELKVPAGECFSLQDLFGDDTTGFVKVTQVINLVLDKAQERGLLLISQQDDLPLEVVSGKMRYRDHVVKELVDTERKYVQDLENLHELKKTIEQKGVIPGDVVHDIFLNINAILDFQRRFLIKIETTNSQPEADQKWGLPFTNYEEAFGIYQPFIANQRKAASIAKREFDKIILANHPVVTDFNTLDGFLLKPMQRLVKYPLLLKDLRDKTNADDSTKTELTGGIDASNRVLMQANAAVDRELRNEALEDLQNRVVDWKNHRVDHFGDLLLHGHFPVVTGKSDVQKEVRPFPFRLHAKNSSKDLLFKYKTMRIKSQTKNSFSGESITGLDVDGETSRPSSQDTLDSQESSEELRRWSSPVDAETFFRNRTFYHESCYPFTAKLPSSQNANIWGFFRPTSEQYTIYLFERILLCCKDDNPNKPKDKLMGQKDKKDKRDKKNKEPNKNAKLQLKGRIFMTNVTEVLSLAKQGSYTVQIFWKGDPGVENFIIRFSNEESMKKWYEGVDGQRKQHASTITSGASPDMPREFVWNGQLGELANPYQQQDEEEEEEDANQPPPIMNSSYPAPVPGMTRNASNTSLNRSRAVTGGDAPSLAGIARAAPPRFPMGLQSPAPLSLQTQLSSQMPEPGQRGGDSYFSPVAESPASSRTSTQSSVFSFPRQGAPNTGWENGEYSRYTAPAMPRAPSRGSQNTNDAYQMNGRQPQRPSLPAMASQSQASVAQQRSRSFSTPDINVQNGIRRLPNGTASQAPVPAVPGIPSHLQSEYYDAGIPRSQNSSPNGMPVRSNTQSPGIQRERLAQAQGLSAPQYTRSNTTQVPISTSDNRTMSPPLHSAMSGDSEIGLPTQLKVKVNCDGNYVTLVVAFNITYQSLVDRIDAKIGRFSQNSIADGTVRLRYRDEDGDFVNIESDDDIQIAFQEWREAQKPTEQAKIGEIELFCLSQEN